MIFSLFFQKYSRFFTCRDVFDFFSSCINCVMYFISLISFVSTCFFLYFCISVDPPGCVDIDDAMGIHWIRDGVLELSVHIADVCAFLSQGSALDLEALSRGTSVYLSHERIDMLPSRISANLASLLGGVDRYRKFI